MNRYTAAFVLALACSTAFGGELAHRATYTPDSIRERGIGSVVGLIDSYAKEQSLVLPGKAPLFLVNGMQQHLSTQAMDEMLSKATSVEVMTDGDAVVINVLT